jgi:hypothetical protein
MLSSTSNASCGQVVMPSLSGGHLAHVLDLEVACDFAHHEVGIDQRRQIDEPCAIGQARSDLLRDGEGQSGLARAARPSQRQQAHLGAQYPLHKQRNVLLATDQRRRRFWQVVERIQPVEAARSCRPIGRQPLRGARGLRPRSDPGTPCGSAGNLAAAYQ